MLGAVHPRRVRLQPHLDDAEIQPAPSAATLTAVVPPGASAAPSTAASGTLTRPHMRDQHPHGLVELDVLDHCPFDTQQLPPYPCKTHAVLQPCSRAFDQLGTLARARRAPMIRASTHPGCVRRAAFGQIRNYTHRPLLSRHPLHDSETTGKRQQAGSTDC
jgi:hypothetical protein